MNGDDSVLLVVDGMNTDFYGASGVDGTGQPWEYLDGYVFRIDTVLAPSATFDIAEWTLSGINVLDGADEAGHIAVTTPGTHQVIPEPSTYAAIAGGLLLIGLFLRRRR